ncbi:cell wall adhesin EAP1-like [Diaphorina citri]|uniref:Cell wall adhesin EAP1-like n=1 Tax=Diaphorina citri TaxID=121845 RepID=A0A3Q0IQA6_DIACI|nr:cell wall adhesin EAP1-like [Diaphorina citri]
MLRYIPNKKFKRYKPSPFLLLDEIDAALDNINIWKTIQYIRTVPKMNVIAVSLKPQFYFHSDILFGITLKDVGRPILTSCLVTLDLSKKPAAQSLDEHLSVPLSRSTPRQSRVQTESLLREARSSSYSQTIPAIQETVEQLQSSTLEQIPAMEPDTPISIGQRMQPASPISIGQRMQPASPISIGQRMQPASPISIGQRMQPASPISIGQRMQPASPISMGQRIQPASPISIGQRMQPASPIVIGQRMQPASPVVIGQRITVEAVIEREPSPVAPELDAIMREVQTLDSHLFPVIRLERVAMELGNLPHQFQLDRECNLPHQFQLDRECNLPHQLLLDRELQWKLS